MESNSTTSTVDQKYVPKKNVKQSFSVRFKLKKKQKRFIHTKSISGDRRKLLTDRPGVRKDKEFALFAEKVMRKTWRHDTFVDQLTKTIKEKRPLLAKPAIRNRLLSIEPKKLDLKTVLDVDEDFFNDVAGRPNPESLNVREYIETLRTVMRTKITKGFRQDDLLLLENTIDLEERMINRINKNFDEYLAKFEEFLGEDYNRTKKLMEECEAQEKVAMETAVTHKRLTKELARLRAVLSVLDNKWRQAKVYKCFLYSMSPVSFRLGRLRSEKSMVVTEEEFGEYTANMARAGTVNDLEVSIMDIRKAGGTDLYFRSPQELIYVFREMEYENLNTLLYCEQLVEPIVEVEQAMQVAEASLDREIARLTEMLTDLETKITFQEERVTFLENLAEQLVHVDFRYSVVSSEVLHLYVYVEDLLESTVGPYNADLEMVQMIKCVISKYYELVYNFDKYKPPETETRQLQELYLTALKDQSLKIAEMAERRYRELEAETNRMRNALAPPYVKPRYKEPKNRSRPRKTAPPPKVFTPSIVAQEDEYLEYFTDYCNETDDLEDFEIDYDLMRCVRLGQRTYNCNFEDARKLQFADSKSKSSKVRRSNWSSVSYKTTESASKAKSGRKPKVILKDEPSRFASKTKVGTNLKAEASKSLLNATLANKSLFDTNAEITRSTLEVDAGVKNYMTTMISVNTPKPKTKLERASLHLK